MHFLRDVGLWWFRLLKDTVDSSSDSVCVLSVYLSDGCFDLGDNLRGRDVLRSYGEVQTFLSQGYLGITNGPRR